MKTLLSSLMIIAIIGIQAQSFNLYNVSANNMPHSPGNNEVIDVDVDGWVVWGSPQDMTGNDEYSLQIIENTGSGTFSLKSHSIFSSSTYDLDFKALLCLSKETMVVGEATNSVGEKAIFINAIDNNNGQIVWGSLLNMDGPDFLLSNPVITKLNEHEFILACEYTHSDPFIGERGIYVLRMTQSGGIVWGSVHNTWTNLMIGPDEKLSLRLTDIHADENLNTVWIAGDVYQPTSNASRNWSMFLYTIDVVSGLSSSDFHYYDLGFSTQRTSMAVKDEDHVYLSTHSATAGTGLLHINSIFGVTQSIDYLPPTGFFEMYFNEMEFNPTTGFIDVLPQYYGATATGYASLDPGNLLNPKAWKFDHVSSADEEAIGMVYAGFGQPTYDHYFLSTSSVPTVNQTVQILYNDGGNCLPTTQLSVSTSSLNYSAFSSEADSRPVWEEQPFVPNRTAFTMDVYNCNRTYVTTHKQGGSETIPETDPSQRVYPNPTQSILNIDFGVETSGEWTLTDAFGRLVKRNTFVESSKDQLDMQLLPVGIYMLSINTDESHETHRIVKSN